MEKRVIFATILSVLFLLFWWSFILPPIRKQPQKLPQVVHEKDIFNKVPSIEVVAAGKDYTIESKVYKIVFNSYGGSVKHWYLKEGPEERDWPDMVLSTGEYFTTFPNLNFDNVSVYPEQIIFSGQKDSLLVKKIFTLSEMRLNKLEIELMNIGREKQEISLLIPWGPGLGGMTADIRRGIRECRFMGYRKISPESKVGFLEKNIKNGISTPDEYYHWIAIDNRYFLLSAIELKSIEYIQRKDFTLYLGKKLNINPGQRESITFRFYLGPKKYTHLKDLRIGLEKTINFGLFSPLSKLAFQMLQFFFLLTKNYGFAIIILTIVLQVILLPLTFKSFKATSKMKTLQPEIRLLQEKYKNDPKRLNLELTLLYKSKKINPLGGCLPMLLQVPIFFALFTALQNLYELRKAPFIFWITDLSSPDLLFSIGNIPVRVLPLLMGLSMFLQQKISGTTLDPTQKMWSYMMPIIFTFIFLNFPSGLVLYWLVNSILTTGVQYILAKKSSHL